MIDSFKASVIENKKLLDIEKKQRIKAVFLRNKFLGEWASSILGLNPNKKKIYIKKVIKVDNEYNDKKVIIRLIEKDFKKRKINISFKEIQFKINDFNLEAKVILENKFKLNNWK